MVSVIIPSYDHARYLKQRIDTVLNQTYQDIEVIILDDCSKDNSKEIIEQYRNDSRVTHIVYNENNSGSTFKQWNKGIALAKGDWVWIAESDDMAVEIFLEELLALANAETKTGIVYANSYFINEEDAILRTYIEEYASWSDRWQHDFVNNGTEEVVKYLRFAPVILNVSSCVFRKSLFEKVNGCDETYKLAGDWLTYVKMLQHADIAYSARPLNYFRCHSQTVRNSSKQFVHFFETIRVICYIYQHFKVPYSEKKAHAYTLLSQLREVSTDFTSEQNSIILNHLRKNFMYHIDILKWKLKASMLINK